MHILCVEKIGGAAVKIDETNKIAGILEDMLKTSNAGYVRMSAGGYHYIVCTDEVWEDIERVLDEREVEE